MKKLANGHFGTGGIKSPKDKRDYKWIGGATTPFDWGSGYDVEEEVSRVTGQPFVLKTKDQMASFSCGGQAFAYYGEVLNVLADKTQEERSAKFIYAPVAYPNMGSYFRDLCARVKNVGWAREIKCPSYLPNGTTTEGFMTAVADITPDAILDAKNDIASGYVSVGTDIDSIASAMKINHGVVICIEGSNNGTWWNEYPVPPAWGTFDTWLHFVYAVGAKMKNGEKQIRIINSWGDKVGANGRQWLNQKYLTSGRIREVRALVRKEVLSDAEKVQLLQLNVTLLQRTAELLKNFRDYLKSRVS